MYASIEFTELLVKCKQLLWLLMQKWSSGQFNPISQDERQWADWALDEKRHVLKAQQFPHAGC